MGAGKWEGEAERLSLETGKAVQAFFFFFPSPPSFRSCYLGQLSCPKSCPSPSLESSERPGKGAMGGRRELCRGKGKGQETDGSSAAQQREEEPLQPAVSPEALLRADTITDKTGLK